MTFLLITEQMIELVVWTVIVVMLQEVDLIKFSVFLVVIITN